MDFGAIINRAFFLVRNNALLWKLGLLAVFTEGMVNVFNFNLPPQDNSQDKVDPSLEFATREIGVWIQSNEELVVALILGGFILMLILWYFSTRAKVGLMMAVDQLEENKDPGSFKTKFAEAKHVTWKVLGLYLIMVIIVAAAIGVLAALFIISPQAGLPALLVAVPLLLILALYLGFAVRVTERKMVLDKGNITDGFRFANQLLKQRLGQAVVAIIIEIGLGILFSLALAAAILVAIGVGALLIILLSIALPKVVLVFIGAVLSILLVAALYFLSAYYAAFISSYWTLIYRAFRYLINIKEENGRE